MAIPKSEAWDAHNLAHRYTVSFFKREFGDEPNFIVRTPRRKNTELIYYNVADSDNNTNATICAGMLVSYMEAQGIPYHPEGNRKNCFDRLRKHLKDGDGLVLFTADIVDHYFKFINEG